MNYNYTACCWFPTSSNILILPLQFWQIRFESYWLHWSKCWILVLLRYTWVNWSFWSWPKLQIKTNKQTANKNMTYRSGRIALICTHQHLHASAIMSVLPFLVALSASSCYLWALSQPHPLLGLLSSLTGLYLTGLQPPTSALDGGYKGQGSRIRNSVQVLLRWS